MSDPVVSNFDVSARPLSDPREGLPPCRSIADFNGRIASMVDSTLCNGGHHFQERSTNRFFVIAGCKFRPYEDVDGWQTYSLLSASIVIDLLTDDPDEAQAAFERGAEWVRTGHIS